MASSKVMASTSSANSDLARQPSIYSLKVPELETDQSKNLGSMSMDELFRNIYGENAGAGAAGDGDANDGGISVSQNVGNKMEDVWKEIVAGGGGGGGGGDRKIIGGGVVVGEEQYFEEAAPSEGMTLEDFLAKRGAVIEEDVIIPPPTAGLGQGMYGVDPLLSNRFQQQQQVDGSVTGFGNAGEGVGLGRAKRRALQEPIDKAAQQKQRRMIKNRESAARSRERKQAYTVELESVATQLEEENERLVKEQAKQKQQRFKQLMENLIPVVEKRRPPRVLRRTRSLQW